MEMAITSSTIPEVLKKDNYKRWKILMRHYLEVQDLWDVFTSNNIPSGVNGRDWTKKTAAALLAIKISCEGEVFDKIEAMNSAKEAWDALADMHKPQSVSAEIEIVQQKKDVSQGTTSVKPRTGPGLSMKKQRKFLGLINKGDESGVLNFCNYYRGARSARIFENGSTALHFTITTGRQRVARILILSSEDSDLEIEDNSNNTPLSLAIRYGRMVVVSSFIEREKSLLLKPDADGMIPVQLACNAGHERLTRYLYCKTPLYDLKFEIWFQLLEECITKKMFDTAFDLLQKFPQLAQPNNCPLGSIPIILTLAQAPPPFFKGSQLIFWKRWIYNSTRVKADYIKQIKDEKIFFDGYDNRSVLTILTIACCPWVVLLFPLCKWICEECELNIPQFIQQSLARARDILQRSLACARKIPEQSLACARRTLQQSLGCVRKVTHPSFDEFKGFIMVLLWELIFMPFSIVTVFVVLVPLSMRALILGRKVSVPVLGKEFECTFIADGLSKLVSLFSWAFARQIYDLKTMDECASKVISLICQPLSNSEQNLFLHYRVVEATFQATKNGIPDILNEIKKAHANILWSSTDPKGGNMFACAVAHRQEKVAQIIYESMGTNLVITADEDDDGNNALHIAAKLAPPSQLGCISGAALQLQSEIRWFKSVEGIVPQFCKEHRNKEGKTPSQVFAEGHKILLKEAEEWIKKTAESSSIVGALIITIMFAAAFTVPGGNDQDTGYPIFLPQKPIPFMVFIVSDAISLFTASSSVLMFLGILTSRYAYDDFLKALPIKLIIGLSSLFISIATMASAFCAALFIMLQGRLEVIIPITLLACIPITFFGWLQFPLLVEIYTSTFRQNIFEKEKESFLESWLYFFCEITIGREFELME